MLEAINLDCVRGERRLFHNLNFHLDAGECLLVRGQNGSGKTSLLRMLVGLTPPAAGAIHWQGSPIKKLGDGYRRELLYCGHSLGLKDDLSATENLTSGMALSDESVTADAVHEALGQGWVARQGAPIGASLVAGAKAPCQSGQAIAAKTYLVGAR